MKKIQLPEQLVDQIKTLPETGMGYHIVTLELKDGRRMPHRTILLSKGLIIGDDEELNVNEITKVLGTARGAH